MKRNYTPEELDFQASTTKKKWNEYIATREERRLEARRKIAAAILVAEMLQESNGRQ